MNFHLTEKKKHIALILLLILLAIIARLQSDHQTDFDSYWLHGMAESIQIHGSALWVYNPASLFGYYPLSNPSGTQFFLATASALTGLSMNSTIFVTALLIGIVSSLIVLLIGYKFLRSWVAGYLAAFLFTLSPIILTYTSFNAGGRVLILVFSLSFLYSIISWKKSGQKKYLLLIVLFFIYSALTHRTSQLMLLFVLAYLGAELYVASPRIWIKLNNSTLYKKIFHVRYKRSKYLLLVDIFILLMIVVVAKFFDLLLRDRLSYNVETRITQPLSEYYLLFTENLVNSLLYVGIGIVCVIGIFILVSKIFKINFWKSLAHTFHKTYTGVFVKPEKYFLWAIIFVFLYLFFGQFFGNSFYSPSINDFQQSEIITGNSPHVIFINMIINYSTSVTPLFLFSILGFVLLVFKKTKGFEEWFLIFTFVGFSGILLDKQYTKMFVVPILSLFAAFGFIKMFTYFDGYLTKKRIPILNYSIIILFFVLVLLNIFTPIIREQIFGNENEGFDDVATYWEAGQYIKSLDCDCSTVTTQEMVAGTTIFASSGVPGASHNVYYFVDEDNLNVEFIGWNAIIENLKNGQKIQSVWILKDWIFGGQFYIGRHGLQLYKTSYTSPVATTIINDYNEKYYIHDAQLEKNVFLESIIPIKNVVYSNPKTTIYSLDAGRDRN